MLVELAEFVGVPVDDVGKDRLLLLLLLGLPTGLPVVTLPLLPLLLLLRCERICDAIVDDNRGDLDATLKLLVDVDTGVCALLLLAELPV